MTRTEALAIKAGDDMEVMAKGPSREKFAAVAISKPFCFFAGGDVMVNYVTHDGGDEFEGVARLTEEGWVHDLFKV